MDNPLNSSIRLLPPPRLIFLILPPSLTLADLPADPRVPARLHRRHRHRRALSLPRGAQAHRGKVPRTGKYEGDLLMLLCCTLSFVIGAIPSCPGAVLDDYGARGVRWHLHSHIRPLPRLQEVRRGRLQVPPDAVQGREVETLTAQKCGFRRKLGKNLAFICVNDNPSGRRWLATGNP